MMICVAFGPRGVPVTVDIVSNDIGRTLARYIYLFTFQPIYASEGFCMFKKNATRMGHINHQFRFLAQMSLPVAQDFAASVLPDKDGHLSSKKGNIVNPHMLFMLLRMKGRK